MEEFHVNQERNLSGSAKTHRDMPERWLDFVSRNLYTYRPVERLPRSASFQICARSRTVEGFTIGRFTTVAGRCRLLRDSAAIGSDSRDSYTLYLSLRGDLEMSQFRRTHRVSPGSFTMISAGDPLVHHKLGGNDTICLLMPRTFVEQRIAHSEDICVLYSSSSSLRRLVAETLATFLEQSWAITDNEFKVSVRPVAELALIALSTTADKQSGERSIRTSHLARARRIIRQHIDDQELTPARIAQEMGISQRYLHSLFRSEGRTVMGFAKAERLQQAREMLETVSTDTKNITDVALDCGFSNISHFSTAFRQTFGCSPRDVVRNREYIGTATAVSGCAEEG